MTTPVEVQRMEKAAAKVAAEIAAANRKHRQTLDRLYLKRAAAVAPLSHHRSLREIGRTLGVAHTHVRSILDLAEQNGYPVARESDEKSALATKDGRPRKAG